MTETDRIAEDAAADVICDVLDSLVRGGFTLDDEELAEKISQRLPEPSATDPRPVRAEPAAVHSIAVQGIRSFGPEQILRLSEGLTIVYAGNGKGKTSLSDAFELVAKGATTRSKGLPQAMSEVKDKDHITHRTLEGTPDPEHPPRVTVRYRRGEQLVDCEWADFDTPAPRHPDLQVLPRRLLRELVNAKRTERIEPLGAALGLAETSASWTAIAKALGEKAKEASEGGEPYLQLLEREVALDEEEDACVPALERWAREQKIQPENLPNSPSADPWRQLACELEAATDPDPLGAPLDSETAALLNAFVEVAEPDEHCPACAQAPVPQARLDEVRALLDASEAAARKAAERTALAQRRDTFAAQIAGWLAATAPPERPDRPEPEDWRQALTVLHDAFTQREQLDVAPWARGVAGALERLDVARAQIAQTAVDDADPARRRAVDAITADADGTRKALDDLKVRRVALAPMLKRAQATTKALLVTRVKDEFVELEGPINDWLGILGPEGTPRISLSAKATSGRPSLDLLVAGLADGATAPHATGYLSDAQLDMLGMSAHLARIERDHPGSTIVIDDPSDMLDSTSRKSLASKGIERLLDGGGPPAHQVLVLTHDDQLVRDLWDGHRHRNPATVQDTMEIHRDQDGTDSYSVLTSRGTAQAVARALKLKKDYWDQHQDRLWFRAAFAAHTRQAVEMCAKDVDMLLGQAGLDLHPENRAPDESNLLGSVSDSVLATLRETVDRWCDHGRHIPARCQLGELSDLLSKSSTKFLNSGAHADVVLPEATSTWNVLERVEKLADQLATSDGHPRSSWTTHSPLAKALRTGQDCPSCLTPSS
ncbi:hypothetical protein BH708_16200 [Brachybacterium sp. P6-10-X1]|uniref:ATP-binding protein n=1 Tax=Brachybacterium sp. P6-10-X1 TaxID=1903186 RepID=UPI00097189B9|nr:ATP-binding protein [Brachybacterium sp. P6-10-X1]APX33995.1 hypothetical protein BH708_16200 [Brachybacterium sp. P6-10-X1]